MYFLISFKTLKSKLKLIVALVMMWLFMVMPLYLEMPALGLGWEGADSPIREILQIRTFICHSFYGAALYIGTLVFDMLLKFFESYKD